VPSDARQHAAAIVHGVTEHRSELDARIAFEAPLIPVAELGRVERTILRSALYEVLYSAATPSGETMRDAVSLARIYAGDAARRLVNGVLGSVSRSGGGA
jgi:N utilization substance protein B